VNGAISTGKEANVYHGIGGNPEKQITVGEVAIKVYKTTLSEFKNRDPYIKDDHRFRDRFSKQNPRKIIHLWAEKEMHNLTRIRKAGIPCPEVIELKKHILVMSFIGVEGRSAPTLKDAVLSSSQVQQAYDETVDIMLKLWSRCDMIHADLSQFNLLWYMNRVWVIDVSQAVLIDHPNALEFLYRDCLNITMFFDKKGATTKSATELFTEICGRSLGEGNTDDLEIMAKLNEYEKNEEVLAHGVTRCDDNFEEMFQKSLQDRSNKYSKSVAVTPSPKETPVLAKSPPKHKK
jgi:RIO kinase 3